MVLASVLLLLVFAVRKVWDAIPKRWIPWGVAAVALALSLADGLMAGESILEIIVGGLETSTMAGGLWGLAKPFLDRFTKKDPDPAA